MLWHYGYSVLFHLSTCQPVTHVWQVKRPIEEINTLCVFRSCSPVHLSTCQLGLTGPDVNIGLHDITVNPYRYIFICRSINLSCCPVYFPSVLLSRLYMEYSFYRGGSGGLAPHAPYRVFFIVLYMTTV